MRLLLKHKADPHIPTFEGTTPLMAAAGINWVFSQTYDEGPARLLGHHARVRARLRMLRAQSAAHLTGVSRRRRRFADRSRRAGRRRAPTSGGRPVNREARPRAAKRDGRGRGV